MLDLIPWPVVALLLGSGAVLLIVLYFDRERERRRREDLVSWAATRGFTIEPGSRPAREAGLPPELMTLPVFSRGRAQKTRNLIRGRGAEGAELIFDYRYTTQSGKHSATLEQTIAAFELPGAGLPAFELRPEGLFARIGQAFGNPDVDFDSSPEFSRHYQLRGSDPAAVRRLFERQAVAHLAPTSGWSVEGASSWMLVFQDSRRQKPDDLTPFLESARSVARSIAGR